MEIRSSGYRVYLKSIGMKDADRIAELANDPELAKNLYRFPSPYTRADAVRFVELAMQSLSNGTAFHLSIRLSDSDTLVGMLGIAPIDLNNKKVEMGYWLGKDYRGKGYANDACVLMMNFVFEHLNLNKIVARTWLHAEKSAKLLERLGFRKEGVLLEDEFDKDRFYDVNLYGILKSENRNKIKIEVKEIR